MASTALAMNNLRMNLAGLVRTMRLRQWIKNLVVFAALVFDGKLLQIEPFIATLMAAICFCLLSSSVYVMNDLVDIEKDREHPSKRLRPLPSGQLHPRFALVSAGFLALIGLSFATWISPWLGVIAAIYLVQNVAYSFYLKDLVIIDVMMIALGFLLRVMAGAVVVHVSNFSPWLYVCMALLALFLGFGKRRHEIALLDDAASKHRTSLEQYNLPLLDQIIGIVTGMTLLSYTFYSFEAETAIARDGSMLLTVPFLFYFMMRYLYLIHVEKKGGAPDELLLEDRPLLGAFVLWALTVVALIYLR